MQQSVEERRGERGVLREGRSPLRERQVARHDGAGSFVALGDHVKEQVRLLAPKGRYPSSSMTSSRGPRTARFMNLVSRPWDLARASCSIRSAAVMKRVL